jgi:hypothetical protein
MESWDGVRGTDLVAIGGRVPFARRHDPAFRERLSGSELRTFFNVGHEWGLAVEQQRVLLGGIPASTYHKWRAGAVGTLSYDQLERISLVLGIYKALKQLFADDASGVRWLKAANTDLPFGGGRPGDHALHRRRSPGEPENLRLLVGLDRRCVERGRLAAAPVIYPARSRAARA